MLLVTWFSLLILVQVQIRKLLKKETMKAVAVSPDVFIQWQRLGLSAPD